MQFLAIRKWKWNPIIELLERPSVYQFINRVLKKHIQLLYRTLIYELQPCPGEWILEVACGNGECSQFIRGSYVGVDLNQAYVIYAAKTYKKTFVASDVLQLSFKSNCMDKIFNIGLFHHLSDSQAVQALNECRRVLNGGGKLVVLDAISPLDSRNRVGSWLRRLDRGRYVRSMNELQRLLRSSFSASTLNSYTISCWPYDYGVVSIGKG